MKTIILLLALFLFATSAFTQKTININVPDFADAQARSFYNNYTSVLIKCVEAIRKKDDAKAIALSKNLLELVKPQEKYGRELIKKSSGKTKICAVGRAGVSLCKRMGAGSCRIQKIIW